MPSKSVADLPQCRTPRDAGDDLLPVCVCDALVEEAEDGERIDVLELICLKLRETHPDRFIDSC